MRFAGQGGQGLRLVQVRQLSHAAMRNTDAGRLTRVRELTLEMQESASALQASEPAGSPLPILADAFRRRVEALDAFHAGNARAARGIAAETIARVQALEVQGEFDRQTKSLILFMLNGLKARSELVLRDFAAAEHSARAALATKDGFPSDPLTDARTKGEQSTLIALALVGQNRHAEALHVIAPVVKLHRGLAGRNRGDEGQKLQMAGALYVQALADPARRAALLAESRALLAGLPGPMKSVQSVRFWSDRVRDAGS
jgi:hypothetical protein